MRSELNQTEIYPPKTLKQSTIPQQKKSHWKRWTNPVFQFVALIGIVTVFTQCSPLAPSHQIGPDGTPGGNAGLNGTGTVGSAAGSLAAVRQNLSNSLSNDQNVSPEIKVATSPFVRPPKEASVKFRITLNPSDFNEIDSNGRVQLYALQRLIADGASGDLLNAAHTKASSAGDLKFRLRVYTKAAKISTIQTEITNLDLRIQYATANEDAMIVLSSQSAGSTASLLSICRDVVNDGFACDIELR